MLKQMCDYWIFMRLKVTEISGSAMAEGGLQAPDQNGLAEAPLKSSIQHFSLRLPFPTAGSILGRTKLLQKNVDIQNNQLEFASPLKRPFYSIDKETKRDFYK